MTSQNQLPFFRHRPTQAGFTLVEIMVGLAIGMLATLVIMQVLSIFETQKRTTTGTADAQTNGSIALYNIARELQIAGYPLMPLTNSPLGCTTLSVDGTLATPNSLSPVAITDGGSASDILTLRYGDSSMGGIPAEITAMVGSSATIDNNFGCKAGDRTLITNGTTCALSSASAVSAASTVPATIELVNTTAAANKANLACLGRWHEVTYQINGNGNLERRDLAISASFDPSVDGIVSLQAQYGISAAANSNQVTEWVDASGATWATPTVANRNRIKAVRIAVVARNAKREGDNVTTSVTAWAGSASSPAPTFTLSNDADGTSWQRYRYRVFETIIPLRNVIWSKDTL